MHFCGTILLKLHFTIQSTTLMVRLILPICMKMPKQCPFLMEMRREKQMLTQGKIVVLELVSNRQMSRRRTPNSQPITIIISMAHR